MTPDQLKKLIREIPDFPKKGILFYDITTLLKDKTGFAKLIDALAAHYIERKIDLVLGIEARGFIFGPALAYRLNAGFVPVRKPKKLPAETAKVTYQLEYGTDMLEIAEVEQALDLVEQSPSLGLEIAGGASEMMATAAMAAKPVSKRARIISRLYQANRACDTEKHIVARGLAWVNTRNTAGKGRL